MRTLRLSFFAVLALPVCWPAQAQTEIVQRLAVPEADELANQMRSLAANPLDLGALIRAGELTLDMGDTMAAAAFFARGERIDPRNGRIKAGLGGILVLAERPGEALRRFAEAESLGRDPRYYAAQRGLAFDLIGQQERAQRDYRLALKTAPDDETVRRYALSLGISGQRDQALEQIDSLLRKSDRGAWRSRAFILAMTGDTAGASRIAVSMMPGGLAQGLQPFFERLPQLSAADRAFAVHFGEVRATPQRLADARLAPSLAPLSPKPGRQVELAATPVAAPLDAKAERREAKRRKRQKPGRVQLAVTTQTPPVPLPQPPAYVASAAPAPVTTLPPVQMASRETAPVRQPVKLAARETAMQESGDGADDVVEAIPQQVAKPVPTPVPRQPVVAAAVVPSPEKTKPVETPIAVPVRVAAVPQRPPISEDSILARIVANISVPGSELEPSPPVRSVVTAAPVVTQVTVVDPDKAETERKLAAVKAVADKKVIADKKVLVDKKVADKKLADKKAADKKEADITKADPARIWVQVSGGANEASLSKAWAQVRDKAPAAFKGKSGWTTPLRSTNRILAGPFKSNDEARSFVNLIAKEGISGFTFTSEAGQKITRLPAK